MDLFNSKEVLNHVVLYEHFGSELRSRALAAEEDVECRQWTALYKHVHSLSENMFDLYLALTEMQENETDSNVLRIVSEDDETE
jgi:hypothetical protein